LLFQNLTKIYKKMSKNKEGAEALKQNEDFKNQNEQFLDSIEQLSDMVNTFHKNQEELKASLDKHIVNSISSINSLQENVSQLRESLGWAFNTSISKDVQKNTFDIEGLQKSLDKVCKDFETNLNSLAQTGALAPAEDLTEINGVQIETFYRDKIHDTLTIHPLEDVSDTIVEKILLRQQFSQFLEDDFPTDVVRILYSPIHIKHDGNYILIIPE